MANKCCVIAVARIGSETFPNMSEIRRQKIARLQNSSARRLSAAAEQALCLALQTFDPGFLPPARYTYLPGGKPVLCDSQTHISLAHGGNWGAAAVSDIPIGLDIEGILHPTPSLIRRCLSAREQDVLGNVPDPDAFFRSAWVARESYVKMTGEGLTIPLASIQVTDHSVNGFPLYRIRFDDHELALCARNTLHIRFVHAQQSF